MVNKRPSLIGQLVFQVASFVIPGSTVFQAVPPAPQPSSPAQSLTVDQAIDMALRQNRSIRMAGEETNHYLALKAKARAEYFPRISNASEASYTTDLQGVVIPRGSFGKLAAGGPIPPETLRIDQGANSVFFSGTRLAQPVTQLFAIHANNQAAQAGVLKAREQNTQTKVDTAYQVRRLFYAVVVSQKQLEAAEASLAAAEQGAREANSGVVRGSGLASSALSANAQTEDARNAVLKARDGIRDSQLALNDQLGLPIETKLELIPPDPLTTPSPDFPSRAQATQEALARQPKVRMAVQAVAEARALLRAAKDAYIPNLSVSAHQSYQNGVSFLVRNYGVFSAQFSYDLFDGGARAAKVRDARSQLASAELALAEQRSEAIVAVEVTYDQVNEALADLKAKQRLAQSQAESARVADSEFTHGELLESKRKEAHASQASAEAMALESAFSLSLARGQLLRALGEITR